MDRKNTGLERPRWGAALATGLALFAGGVGSHPIVVDGQDDDWVLAAPTYTNTGHVGRNVSSQGEFVWRDAPSDARTDFANPELDGEIEEFRVTADASKLYFLVTTRGLGQTSGENSVQVQVAVDLDQVNGSGTADFVAAADTSVSADARWEFLIATRFGSGATDVNVFTSSSSSSPAGEAAITQGAGLLEFSVPWTALGLGGPPPTPLRLSVASFRSSAADVTLDLGGASVSNAVDAITNNDSPGFSVPTASETGDQVLDYYLDVWFDAQGDVVAPLLISAFQARPSTFIDAEWVQIHNRSGVAIDLDGYRMGDEETATASENMSVFSARIILPGGFVVAARSASAYASGTGLTADFEIEGTDAGVPDMAPDLAWGTGSFELSDGGDHVLLLDGQRSIIDAVAYGTGGIAGVEPLAAPGNGEIDYRAPVGQDRNLAADFSSAAADLTVILVNGEDSILEGAAGEYEIEVSNNGPDDAFAASLDLDRLEGLTITNSECRVIDLGAACGAIDPVGVSGVADLPVNTRVAFTLSTSAGSFAEGPAIVEVSATPPVGVAERFPDDNAARDSNAILSDLLFRDGYESD